MSLSFRSSHESVRLCFANFGIRTLAGCGRCNGSLNLSDIMKLKRDTRNASCSEEDAQQRKNPATARLLKWRGFSPPAVPLHRKMSITAGEAILDQDWSSATCRTSSRLSSRPATVSMRSVQCW